MVKDVVSSSETKQQCLRGMDGEAVTTETASSADVEMKTDDDGYDDAESDEVEDGELVSSSSSESELELEETVEEKGKKQSVFVSPGCCLSAVSAVNLDVWRCPGNLDC